MQSITLTLCMLVHAAIIHSYICMKTLLDEPCCYMHEYIRQVVEFASNSNNESPPSVHVQILSNTYVQPHMYVYAPSGGNRL